MKLATFILLLAIAICAYALPAKENVRKDFKKCEKNCANVEKIICGHGDGLKISFYNQCILDKYNCENNKATMETKCKPNWLHGCNQCPLTGPSRRLAGEKYPTLKKHADGACPENPNIRIS